MKDATAMNRAWWDQVTPQHTASRFYDVEGFLAGASTLGKVERDAIGDVAGKRVLHLQCHIGLDTLSLARFGAEVVGLDFSSASVAAAQDLAEKAGLAHRATFMEGDVLDAGVIQGGDYDMVFTTHGTYTWLSSMERWAKTVADNLAPDGFFYFLDHHPMVFMLEGIDERGEPRIVYPYINQGAELNVEGTVDYAEPERKVDGQTTEHFWSISDVFQGFERNGLTIREMREYPFCGYAYLPDMTKGNDGYYHRPEGALAVPLLLAFKAGW